MLKTVKIVEMKKILTLQNSPWILLACAEKTATYSGMTQSLLRML